MQAASTIALAAITYLYPLNLNTIERDGGGGLSVVSPSDIGDQPWRLSLTFYAYIILLKDAFDVSLLDLAGALASRYDTTRACLYRHWRNSTHATTYVECTPVAHLTGLIHWLLVF